MPLMAVDCNFRVIIEQSKSKFELRSFSVVLNNLGIVAESSGVKIKIHLVTLDIVVCVTSAFSMFV